jgi:hypothetical protein
MKSIEEWNDSEELKLIIKKLADNPKGWYLRNKEVLFCLFYTWRL